MFSAIPKVKFTRLQKFHVLFKSLLASLLASTEPDFIELLPDLSALIRG